MRSTLRWCRSFDRCDDWQLAMSSKPIFNANARTMWRPSDRANCRREQPAILAEHGILGTSLATGKSGEGFLYC